MAVDIQLAWFLNGLLLTSHKDNSNIIPQTANDQP